VPDERKDDLPVFVQWRHLVFVACVAEASRRKVILNKYVDIETFG
jgi:hypothetical protein